MWTRAYFISFLSKSEDLAVTENRLLEIPAAFYNVLRIYYGDASAKDFETLLQTHLMLLIKLTEYLSEGNLVMAAATEKDLYFNADQMAHFLSQTTPQEFLWRNILYTHLDQIKDELMKRIYMDYYGEVNTYDIMEYHVLMIADLMAKELIKRFYG